MSEISTSNLCIESRFSHNMIGAMAAGIYWILIPHQKKTFNTALFYDIWLRDFPSNLVNTVSLTRTCFVSVTWYKSSSNPNLIGVELECQAQKPGSSNSLPYQ